VGTQFVLLGLDGATFDLILPWAQSGDLPTLARLLKEGAWGPLASTTPPTSFPAWSTVMTGANPGRHGLYDFTQRLAGRYEVGFVNATHRRMPSLWQRASTAGRRVAALGFPGTYPPEAVNGLLVSGFDSPVATAIGRRCVYPPERYRDVAPYPLGGIQEVRIGPGWHERALAQLLAGVERRTAVALRLLREEPWDLFALHYGESDTVAHHFWAFHDRQSPRCDPADAGRFGHAIQQVYRALDRALGRLLETLPDATVAILSDHGSGGAGEWVVHLNRWLAEHGWLRFAGGGTHRFAAGLRRLGLCLPAAWQEWAFRGPLRGWVDRIESHNRLDGIDWAHTAAFSEEVNTLPGIWLNVRGREPAGTVAPEQYERWRAELITALGGWRHPETGAPLLVQAWRREDLYQGPWVHLAPDIVLEPALDRGYSVTFLSSGGQPGPALRRLMPQERLGAKGGSMNGSHRPTGILLLAGAGVLPGVHLRGAALADIAPTTLAALGLPLPPGLDGHVLQDAFLPGSLCEQAGPATKTTSPPAQPYSPEEEAAVLERLRGLGYRE
jgi:predicted AlkP superfamily phosphohydrolase/phosphomutase